MEKLKYPTKEELSFYETLRILWKEFVNIEDFKMISKEKGEKIFNWLKRKKILIKYFNENYIFRFQYSINPKIITENLVNQYLITKWKEYYFWWIQMLNIYRITEQMPSYNVVYNNYINWIRKFNWTKVLFKKTNRLDLIKKFKTIEEKEEFINLVIKKSVDAFWNEYNVGTLEQIIYDTIEEPWYIGGDYDKLIRFLQENEKTLNIDKLIKLFEIYWVISNLLKLFYILNKAKIPFDENILLKYRKEEKIYRKLYNNNNPIIKKDKKFKLYINW